MAAETGEPDPPVGQACCQFREVAVRAGTREVTVNRGCFLGEGQGIGVAAETCQADTEVAQRGGKLRAAGACRLAGGAAQDADGFLSPRERVGRAAQI
jgi:hypothetical protein